MLRHRTRSSTASPPFRPFADGRRHTLLAIYDGDANCSGSTSTVYTQNAYLLDYYFPWFPNQGD